MTTGERARMVRRGLILASATVAWNVVEGIVAVGAGIVAGSVALIGFGVDSFIETASAGVVAWRLRAERRGGSVERVEQVERRASRIAGGLLLGLALYIAVDGSRRLLGFGGEAEESVAGMVLTAVSLVVMPLLGWGKLRTAKDLGSVAFRADAFETIACAWLSLTTLTGLVLNATFGFWWADPAAALLLLPFIVREALECLRALNPSREDAGPRVAGAQEAGSARG